MEQATIPGSMSGPAAIPSRSEAVALLGQVLRCSREEKRYLLEQLLHDYLGEHPPKELGIYDANGQAYVYILEPEHRIRLFVTPERLARWAAQNQEPADPEGHNQLMALLDQGNEEAVKAWLAARNA